MNSRWYVAQTHPRHETVALAHLRRQRFNGFLPLIKTARGVLSPLFPGYLFVELDLCERWQAVNGTRGVRRLLGGENPLPVPVGYVEALEPRRALLGVQSAWEAGKTRLRMVGGQFMGFEGLYQATAGERVKILLQLLGRSVVVSAPSVAVEVA